MQISIPDSKVHRVNMGPTWVLSAPDGPLVGPMNLAIRDGITAASHESHTASNTRWIGCWSNSLFSLTAPHYWPFVGVIHRWSVDCKRSNSEGYMASIKPQQHTIALCIILGNILSLALAPIEFMFQWAPLNQICIQNYGWSHEVLQE